MLICSRTTLHSAASSGNLVVIRECDDVVVVFTKLIEDLIGAVVTLIENALYFSMGVEVCPTPHLCGIPIFVGIIDVVTLKGLWFCKAVYRTQRR